MASASLGCDLLERTLSGGTETSVTALGCYRPFRLARTPYQAGLWSPSPTFFATSFDDAAKPI